MDWHFGCVSSGAFYTWNLATDVLLQDISGKGVCRQSLENFQQALEFHIARHNTSRCITLFSDGVSILQESFWSTSPCVTVHHAFCQLQHPTQNSNLHYQSPFFRQASLIPTMYSMVWNNGHNCIQDYVWPVSRRGFSGNGRFLRFNTYWGEMGNASHRTIRNG
jgi:hypothetical protein